MHMMAPSTSFIVTVAALLISLCSAENVYCVTPTATSCSSCPHNSTNCTTLSEYAQEAELYFTSNATMVFLPGDHVLDRNITVANVARLTMRGESSSDNVATVVRNGSIGFSFTNMLDFNIYSLAFTSYNKSWSYGSHPASNSALFLRSTQNAELVNCFFHDNLGTALTLHNTSVTLEGINKFIHNQCACQSFSDSEGHACGIAALNSNLTFIGNTSFHENTQTNSFSSYCGGAIWTSGSSLQFSGTNSFINNSVSGGGVGGGGAIYAKNNSSLSFSGTSNFTHNSAEFGGAITTIDNVMVTFNGTSKFVSNTANNAGGAIVAYLCGMLTFHGTNNFVNNSANYKGGAIYTKRNIVLTFKGTNNFNSNSASFGGAIHTESNSSLSFIGSNGFILNSADVNGGSIYTDTNSSLSFIGTNDFILNSAGFDGGAINSETNSSLSFSGTTHFSHNSAWFGGAINTETNTSLSFSGNSHFSHNSALFGGVINAETNTYLSFSGTTDFSHNSASDGGGAIYADNVTLKFTETTNFFNNTASSYYGGAIYVADNTRLSLNGTSSLTSNFAVQGGAIFAYESTLTLSGNISFVSNGHDTEDSRGGALYMYISSTFSILPNTTVRWENNHANLGGAIYVYDANPYIYCTAVPKQKCFFQLPGQNLHRGLDVQIVFKNNSADTAGSVLYGGAIDNCTLNGLESNSSGEVFDKLFQYERDNTTSSISSDPFRICPCENNSPNCSQSSKTLTVYPGNSYQVSVVVVGQKEGIVPANVTIVDECKLLCSQTVQSTSKTCTTLNYTVDPQQKATLNLYADGHCSTDGGKLVLELNGTQRCPVSQENSSKCICDQALKYGIEDCSITTESAAQITRHSNETFWVSYNSSFIFHPHCPFEYCVNDEVVFSPDNPDMQCARNRTGTMCGQCKDNYSLALGTFKCMECTNDNYLALIVVFAVMGIALVIMLLVCKLTVATGTLSGLVFYANIVGANRTIFDPLPVFIAWLNLDFGIETCFYDGMDAYIKTWLQFVFPVYLWLLVGLMILISHYSKKFAHLLGNNPVSVLATLILLSYAKILRTLIAAVYIIHLEYPKDEKVVWFYDATDYLSIEHIILLLVAMFIFIFLFLPYTLLLLFGQWLQTISHLRFFSWVNRLKPFMDSYHAPYKAKHRYWPGLLLVLRFVLLLVFALNPQQDPSINLLAILLGAAILHMWAWFSGGVYKKWCLDVLEGSFVLNLIILVGATYHVKLTGGNQLVVGYTSVSIALATFIAILTYHIFQQVRHTKLWKRVPKLNLVFKKLNKKPNTNQAEDGLRNFAEDTSESGNFDQLREPLLDDPPKPTHSVV